MYYDAFGRLEEARIEEIHLAAGNSWGDVVERYTSLPATPRNATATILEGGSLLDEVKEQAESTLVRVLLDPTFNTSKILHPVTSLRIGELDYALDVDVPRQATVTDADNVTEMVTWDEYGRPRTMTVGGTQTTKIDYLPIVAGKLVFDPLVDVVTLPTGATIVRSGRSKRTPRPVVGAGST